MRSSQAATKAVVIAVFTATVVLTVVKALQIQAAAHTSIPQWDFWDEIPYVQLALAGHLHLSDLWAQANEHRILLTRLQIIADYWLFGGQLVFLLAMSFVSSVALAVVLTVPFAAVWRNRTVTLGFFAFALAATLSPVGSENLTLPFAVSFVQVYLFATGAIAIAACSSALKRRESRPRILVIVAMIALAGAATYSMANGLVVWPILVAILILRRTDTRSIWVVSVVGALFIGSYLWHYHPVASHSPYARSLEHPLGMAHYVATFLGHPAEILGSHAVSLLGVVGVALLAWLVVLAIRDRRVTDRRQALFGASVGTFVFITAVQTALGRLEFGIAQALSPRYEIAAAVFWVSLAVGFAPYVASNVAVLLRVGGRALNTTALTFVAACLAATVATNLASAPSHLALDAIRKQSEPMLVAYTAGVMDDAAFRVSYPAPDVILPYLRWLRAERLGPWDSGLGDSLETAQRPVLGLDHLSRCTGSVDSVKPVQGGQRLDGWIVPPAGSRSSGQVDVVDGSGASDGVGLVDVYRPDVKAAGASSSDYSGFVGYFRGSRAPAGIVLSAADSTRALCVLPITRS